MPYIDRLDRLYIDGLRSVAAARIAPAKGIWKGFFAKTCATGSMPRREIAAYRTGPGEVADPNLCMGL